MDAWAGRARDGLGRSSADIKGQDENLHIYVNAVTGETREATQREFKNSLRDLGFVEQEDAADVETPEAPA